MSNAAKQVLGGREHVRVCIAQVSPVYMNRNASARRAVETIAEAAANGADLVVFTEAWLSGYPHWTEGWDSALARWAQGRVLFYDEAVTLPSETTDMIAKAARDARIHVVLGCNEMDHRPGNGTIYNSLLFFDRTGTLIGRHRKLMPTFTERLFWGAGDGSDLAVYETDIGRIGGLICGENLMTPVRASMIAMAEDFHVAVFPGSFALHTGPQLQEWDMSGSFWGHFVTRAHAFEGGCFVLSGSGYLDENEIDPDFPYRGQMNIGWARGGSQIVSPLGVPIKGPVEGSGLIYADCQAWMIKAVKALVDTIGHYSRPDAVRVLVRKNDRWQLPGQPYVSGHEARLDRSALQRAADSYEVSMEQVEAIADNRNLLIDKG